jgi:serpin B
MLRAVFPSNGDAESAVIVRPEEPGNAIPYKTPGETMPNIGENELVSAKKAAVGVNLFAFDIYKELSKETTDNIFFSPQNISSAFVMLYAGSGGDTKSQMERVFRYKDDSLEDMGALQLMLSATPQSIAVFSAANAVWPDVSLEISKTWESVVRRYAGDDITRLDYKKSGAENGINGWTEAKTHGRIKNLVGELSPETSMVLTSALYFKSEWNHEFPKENTKRETFYGADDAETSADIMHRRGSIDYCETAMFQAVRIPYEKDAYSMIAMLPRDRDDLGGQLLASEIFDQVMTSFSGTDVELYLPRFKMETQYKLPQYLISLGLESAFSGKADFSGITKSPVSVSEAIHKTFIKVDEKQTEATAVTIITVLPSASMALPETKVFRADHPFIYFIVENRTNAILFMGRYSKTQ